MDFFLTTVIFYPRTFKDPFKVYPTVPSWLTPCAVQKCQRETDDITDWIVFYIGSTDLVNKKYTRPSNQIDHNRSNIIVHSTITKSLVRADQKLCCCHLEQKFLLLPFRTVVNGSNRKLYLSGHFTLQCILLLRKTVWSDLTYTDNNSFHPILYCLLAMPNKGLDTNVFIQDLLAYFLDSFFIICLSVQKSMQ